MNHVLNARRLRDELSDEVNVLAASKSRSFEMVKDVVPFVDFVGENYVQEAGNKFGGTSFGSDIRMIGHLQKNKINDAIRIFDSIDSVESVYRAKHINKRVLRDSDDPDVTCPMPVMVEVNIAEEDSKYGVEPKKSEVERVCSEIREMEGLVLEGLMTMGPSLDESGKLRHYFSEMRGIFDHVVRNVCDLEYLSMGMSGSYGLAVEEGSNLVRIGSAIFGPRDY